MKEEKVDGLTDDMARLDLNIVVMALIEAMQQNN